MTTETYLILRVKGARGQALDPLAEATLRGEPVATGFAETDAATVAVSTESLTARELHDIRRDPSVKSLAQPMPLQLIQPVAATERASANETTNPEPIHGATWGVFVTGALQSPYVGHGVTVAVLDTGIDAGHEAFRDITLIQKDFTGEGDGDRHGHGTHVAGTIFGQTGHGVRYGVAPGVRRALIGKVLGQQHGATTKEVVDAVQWAVEQGAHIINLSLGFDFPGLVKQWAATGLEVDLATSRALAQYRDNVRLFDDLVNWLGPLSRRSTSALIVAAAGNESRRQHRADYVIEVAPPAAADGVIAVAALQSAGAPHNLLSVARFSNIRAALAAPGVGIYSAKLGGGYTFMNGTSMASPHVAGVAALWAERQFNRNGVVNVSTLEAQVRGNTQRDRLPAADYLDVGEGLVAAPAE